MLESLALSSETFNSSLLLILCYVLWRRQTQGTFPKQSWPALLGGFGLLFVGSLLNLGHGSGIFSSTTVIPMNAGLLILLERGIVLPLGYILLGWGMLRGVQEVQKDVAALTDEITACRETQARFEHLLTVSPAVIYSSQPDSNYETTFISANIQNQLGYPPQAFLETPGFWTNHIHPQDQAQVLAKQQTLLQHDTLCYEYRFRHQDGHYCWMRDEQRLVRDRDGQSLEIVGYWVDITAHKQTEDAYRQHREFLQTLLDHLPVMIAYLDPQGRLQWINQELERALGWPLSALKQEELKQRDFLVALYPDLAYRQQVRAFIQEAQAQWTEFRPKMRDGRTLDTTWISIKLSDGSCIGIGQDITVRKQTEQTQRQLSAILEASTDFVGWADTTGIARYVNRAGCEMVGITTEEAIGQPITAFSPNWANTIIQNEGLPKAEQRGWWRGETALLDRQGREIPVSQLILAHRNPAGELEFFSTVAHDIRERKAYEAQLEHQANYDCLTGLPNRNLLQERLKHSLAHARRSHRQVAVLFLDLDRFKRINDSLGHSAGDALLQAVATCLGACIREEDTVARLGNDEFVLVLEDLPQNGDLRNLITHKILDALNAPFQIAQQNIFVSAQVGVSLFPNDSENPQLLLKQANIAMHYAKKRGWHGLQFYTAGMNAQSTQHFTLENDLWYALERKELEIHYQPQVDISQGQIIGVEALLRWRHPSLGLVAPAKFIPLAEESGLIFPIGQWVLQTACTQIQLAGGRPAAGNPGSQPLSAAIPAN